MAYNRRQQRRQGIRYGPVRERDRFSDNGVLIGRLLGLAILLLTLGVLAAGALAFMGDRPAATSTPRRTAFAPVAISPKPSTATARPTLPPSTAALATPSALPTPIATHVPPLVQIGEGYVTFGTRANKQLHILDPRSTFTMTEWILWSAYLAEPANSADLRLQVFKLDTTSVDGERLILDEGVTPNVIGAQIFQRKIRAEGALDGPGVYVVRYLRGVDVLSEGSLEITA